MPVEVYGDPLTLLAGSTAPRSSNKRLPRRQCASFWPLTIDTLWRQDKAAYFVAFETAVRQVLTERGITCGIEVDEPDAGDQLEVWDPLVEELHQEAHKRTPLPMTGEAPNWTDGTPADALHRAGLTYTVRAQEAMR